MNKKSEKIVLQEELERRILYGLSREWKTMLFLSNPPDIELMNPPLFSLRNMKNIWGCWNKEKREISLSRNLVLNHSWDSSREVLLHEMAHQYTDEVLLSYSEPPHGPLFQKACHLLHANPKASGNFRPKDERPLLDHTNEEDKILRRIRKLMALSESANKHEAEAAMAKAHELISKYNKEIIEYNKSRKFISIFLGKPALRHSRFEYALSSLLDEFYFIKTIWLPSYVLKKGKMGTVLEISGTIQNIQTACYVYDFVSHFIDTKWTLYNKDKGLNKYRKIDFGVGIINGFRFKLNSQNKQEGKQKETHSLIKHSDPMLHNYFKEKYPRTSNFTRKATGEDKKVKADGINIGKNMVIYKGIKEKNETVKGLICGQ